MGPGPAPVHTYFEIVGPWSAPAVHTCILYILWVLGPLQQYTHVYCIYCGSWVRSSTHMYILYVVGQCTHSVPFTQCTEAALDSLFCQRLATPRRPNILFKNIIFSFEVSSKIVRLFYPSCRYDGINLFLVFIWSKLLFGFQNLRYFL